MLEKIENIIDRLRQRGVGDGKIIEIITRVIHSPAVELIVKLTPNTVDDAVLEILQSLIPKPA